MTKKWHDLTMHTLKPRSRYDWELRTRTLELGECTVVMAIVKLGGGGSTAVLPMSQNRDMGHPGRTGEPAYRCERAVEVAIQAVDDGAQIVDLSAEFARPGATFTADEEQARLLPVLEALRRARPEAIISVDTHHAATALAAARLGAEIVNDLSGLLWDPEMGAAVAATGCGLVLMHTRGRSRESLAHGPMSRDEVVPAIFSGLCESIALAEVAGIETERIAIDPGFGFGKRGAENFTLLAQLGRLNQLGRPMVIGLSRKGFLGDAVRPLQPDGLMPAEARRTATIAANTAAVLAGAHILRVHDVQAAREAAVVADQVLAARVQ